MTNDELFVLVKRVDPMAMRVPPGLTAIAAEIEAAERARICAAIKAEDDHCCTGDYMMDSDDCIEVVRGTWKRQDYDA